MKKNVIFLLSASPHHLILLFSFLLFPFSFLPSPLNAQVYESRILDSVSIQKNELKVTPEVEKMVITKLKEIPENYYSDYGIKNKEQLENLHLGKPIPWYQIVNEKLVPVNASNVSHLVEGEPLSLIFTDRWNVPVMNDDEPLVFVFVGITDREYTFLGPGYIGTRNSHPKVENMIEHIYNYEHKDLLMGSFEVAPLGNGLDFLIIKKEDKDVFVEVYNEATGEYFKNEYGSNEIMKLLKDRAAKINEARNRYYAYVADKSELVITPEIAEMLLPYAQSYWSSIRDNEEYLSQVGIKNGALLEHLHLGKPVPAYRIIDENLTFIGRWKVPVMSNGEPLFFTEVKLEVDGQYRWMGSGGAGLPQAIQNYEYKDMLIGFLGAPREWDYLFIRKNGKDIFVKTYDWETRELFKTEYSLSDIINLLKK